MEVPELIIDALHGVPYSDGGAWISVTSLIDSPRVRCLKKRHPSDEYESVFVSPYRVYGSLIHQALMNIAADDAIVECRMTEAFGGTFPNGLSVSGQPDVIIPTEHGYNQLWDLKFTSVRNVTLKDEWEKQLNVYAYIAGQQGLDINEAYILALYRDWKPDEDGPTCKVIEVPLWTQADQLDYIEYRVDLHRVAEKEGDWELPYCTKGERWAKPSVFAVGREGKRAIRLLPTSGEAYELAWEKNDLYQGNDPEADEYKVTERPGKSVRCGQYCDVRPFCNQSQRGDV